VAGVILLSPSAPAEVPAGVGRVIVAGVVISILAVLVRRSEALADLDSAAARWARAEVNAQRSYGMRSLSVVRGQRRRRCGRERSAGFGATACHMPVGLSRRNLGGGWSRCTGHRCTLTRSPRSIPLHTWWLPTLARPAHDQ